MAAPLPLEGDGLVENLFHYLWTTDDLDGGPRVSVPPTVIFRGLQPVAWYFTSRKSGRIKRKHRANLTAAHIEHAFTKRKAATDIVAYYLYLPKSESNNPAIEYYDAESLREFLFKRPEIPHSSSPGSVQAAGILQQFALPKGARNSTLRAIWSPKLCLLERRVNVHAIHDPRFSVYERGVTFEEGGGAEALSRPEPVRGSMLPGMVQQLCERVVDHVTRVSYHKFRIARMVLRIQVDVDDRLWLLWSSSLRLQPLLGIVSTMITSDTPTGEPAIRPLDIVSDAKVPAFAFAQGSGGGLVSLSSTSSPEVNEDPRPGQTRCASCAQVVAHRALLPTTYKAVLAHFQHVLKFVRESANEENHVAIEWPPDERVVQQAGGVGFGILRHLKSVSSSSDDNGGPKVGSALGPKGRQGRELLVPPVIRYLHPTLRVEDFARHRQDPIFLHKTVGVCERCCLVYADYATASLEANALGIRSSASAPALLRPTREMPKYAEYFDDDPSDPLLLTTNSSSLVRGARATTSKMKPPAAAWKPVPTDDRQQGRFLKYKAGPRSTLHSLPMAPKLPPRIDTFEPEDNDALRIPDGILHDDGSPQHEQQQREEAFFRELYQQKDTAKRGGHALRHILEAADRLSKAKPQHRLAALGTSTQIGQSQSTGALVGAITELKLAKRPGKNPYTVVQRIRDGAGALSKNQAAGNASPAKSPQKHQAKSSRKKISKKAQAQDDGGAERARFVSSREKKAAAAHRGYLVAALSDAQVQLEHIESLATLVISAPDIDVNAIEPEQKEKRHCRKKNGDEDNLPPGPRGQSIVDQDEGKVQDQENHEYAESQLDRQEDQIEEPGESDFDEEEIQDHEAEDVMQVEQEHVEDEKLETLGYCEDTSVVELLQGEGNVLDGQQQENDEDGENHDQEPIYDNNTAHVQELRFQEEDTLLAVEQSEPELVHNPDEMEEQKSHQETNLDEDQVKEQKSEFCEQEDTDHQELVQSQEDKTQDEYEYGDPDREDPREHEYQQHHIEVFERDDSFAEVTAQGEFTPAVDFLEQAQELLATAVSSGSMDDASDEHEASQDCDVSSDTGGNDQYISMPFVFQALEGDSRDDAVMAADSDVAAALPLPLSDDEAASAASDE
ncbi:uncharacterized protein KRP23_8790 [Phytophthora ramorum]|uniref:uncharacterized protein n=1 Tax=Phytophthora ramorum TaxID=164328 RepID=UPI0030AF68BC|nr:hypothetical protein KRP23_8790 [Phytophthora ramorum]